MPANGTEAATLSQIKEYVEYAIANQTPPTTDIDIDKIYPVGSIYMSMSLTSPSSLFGGTWQRIQSRYLMASDSTYTAGETGGNNDAIVVSHSHSASSEVDGGHSHSISGGSHSHSGTATSSGSHTHPFNYVWNAGVVGGSDYRIVVQGAAAGDTGTATSTTRGIANGGSHTHSLSVNTSSSHSHTVSSNGDHAHNVNIFSSGSSGTNKNMPEFIAVNVWKRTA